MKKHIITSMLALLFIGVQAQQKIISQEKPCKYGDSCYNERLEKLQKRTRDSSEYIFEGNLQNIDTYNATDKNGYNYIIESRTINITKEFRGKLKLGTVEMVQTIYPNGKMGFSPHKKPQKDTIFIYFCSEVKKYPYDNLHKRGYFENKVFLEYYGLGAISLLHQKSFDGSTTGFHSLGSIYQYIESFPNIKKP